MKKLLITTAFIFAYAPNAMANNEHQKAIKIITDVITAAIVAEIECKTATANSDFAKYVLDGFNVTNDERIEIKKDMELRQGIFYKQMAHEGKDNWCSRMVSNLIKPIDGYAPLIPNQNKGQ